MPHQGGYVETPSGQGWFVHFNSTGAYGRLVHLQPVRWEDDWPVMGERLPGADHGQPVATHALPEVGRTHAPVAPQTSDEFSRAKLGLQWEWNHNPADGHWSLTERPGFLRLKALPADRLVTARNTLTQVMHGAAPQVTARLDVTRMADGQKAGLAMFGKRPSWIGVVQRDGKRHVGFSHAGSETPGEELKARSIVLRVNVSEEHAVYAYSLDEGKTFKPIGTRAKLLFSWWKGARPALFSYTERAAGGGMADFDWLRVDEAGDPSVLVLKR